MKPVPTGVRGETEETVEFQHTLTWHHPELPPVYSTPDMIRLMEVAAFHALQPYCEGDEISVGTAIHIESPGCNRRWREDSDRSGVRSVRWALLYFAGFSKRRCPGDWPWNRAPGNR